MTEKFPMTKVGLEKLKSELDNLKNVERPNITKAISEAREHGCLKMQSIMQREKSKVSLREKFQS